MSEKPKRKAKQKNRPGQSQRSGLFIAFGLVILSGMILVFVLNTNNPQRQFEQTSTAFVSTIQARVTEIVASATAYAKANATQAP